MWKRTGRLAIIRAIRTPNQRKNVYVEAVGGDEKGLRAGRTSGTNC
jgi:hypothetical protein